MIDEYCYDRLVVGGSLECLLYCFVNSLKVVVTDDLYPLQTFTVDYDSALRFLGYSNKDVIHKSEMWDRLSFIMSMSGLLVVPNIISSHRLVEDCLVLATEHNKRIKIRSDEIIFFDKINENEYTMVDWFDVRSGNNHDFKVLEDRDDNFISKVIFYPSKRIGRNSNLKDIMAISNFSGDEINNVNYGEGIARLKVLKMM